MQNKIIRENIGTVNEGKKYSKEMWWLIGSSPDFWGSRGPGFESGISHMILGRCRIIVQYCKHLRVEGGTSTWGQKKYTVGKRAVIMDECFGY